MKVEFELTPYSKLVLENGKAFKVYHGLPHVADCRMLCGKRLHRPHFTCLKCQDRDVLNGRLPPCFEVLPFLVVVRKNRRFGKAKNWMLKQAMRFIEVFIAN